MLNLTSLFSTNQIGCYRQKRLLQSGHIINFVFRCPIDNNLSCGDAITLFTSLITLVRKWLNMLT